MFFRFYGDCLEENCSSAEEADEVLDSLFDNHDIDNPISFDNHLGNVCFIKFCSKHSTVLILCLLRNLMEQSLCMFFRLHRPGGQPRKVSRSRNKIVEL